MVVLWIVHAVVLIVEFSSQSQASTICNCNDSLRTVCAGPSDLVLVPCPGLDPAVDFVLQLVLNQRVLSTFCSRNKTSCNPPSPTNHSARPFSLTNHSTGPVSLTNHSSRMGFTFKVLDLSSPGVYRCEGKSIYPPPVRKERGEGILLLVKGVQCGVGPGSESVVEEQVNSVWIVWIVLVVSLGLLCLLSCISAVYLWRKLRTAECQNDYMNTKPRPTKRHGANQRRGQCLQLLART